MSSRAAQASRRANQLLKKGLPIQQVMEQVYADHPPDLHHFENDRYYAEYSEGKYHESHLEVFASDYTGEWIPRTVTNNAGNARIWRLLRDIRAYCHECGVELQCDHKGKPIYDSWIFDLPGQQIFLCPSCQRSHVIRSLVGE